MATQCVIGVFTDDQQIDWRGRFVFQDGYPQGVGATIYRNYQIWCRGALEAMINLLVTNEKVGWLEVSRKDFVWLPVDDVDENEEALVRMPWFGDKQPDEWEGNYIYRSEDNERTQWAYILFAGATETGYPVNRLYVFHCTSEYPAVQKGSMMDDLMYGDERVMFNINRWKLVGNVNLDDDLEPDWEAMEHV